MLQKLIFPALFLGCLSTSLAQTTYTFTGGVFLGHWDNPANWTPNGVPGPDDTAIIDVTPGNNSGMMISQPFTVGTLFIRSYFDLLGQGVLTVQDSMHLSYPGHVFIDMVLGPGAGALINDDNYPDTLPDAFHVFNKSFTIDGAATFNADKVSVVEGRINGTLTVLKGGLYGHQRVNPTGMLTLDAPDQTIKIGRITNHGYWHWKNGNIVSMNDTITNTGLWRISASGDTLISEDVNSDSSLIINTQSISVADSVESSVTIIKSFLNAGFISIADSVNFRLFALENYGVISGQDGSTLELGNYNNKPCVFYSNSQLEVPHVKSVADNLIFHPGADLNFVKLFTFIGGEVVLGASVTYSYSSFVIGCPIVLPIPQTFKRPVFFSGGASLSGPGNATFNRHVTIDNYYFSGTGDLVFNDTATVIEANFSALHKVIVSPGAVLNLRVANVGNLINDGEVWWYDFGALHVSPPGIQNNGVWNITASLALADDGGGNDNLLFKNNGVINMAGSTTKMYVGLINEGQIEVNTDGVFEIGKGMQQHGEMNGENGSFLRFVQGYPGVGFNFFEGSKTKGFDKIKSEQSDVNLNTGAVLEALGELDFENGQIDVDIVLPPTFKYRFYNDQLTLNTLLEPSTLLTIQNTDVNGTGEIRVLNHLDWIGGDMQVPLLIESGATAKISENSLLPVLSAPLINHGEVTLTTGMFNINTDTLINYGDWLVGSFVNAKIFGDSPFRNNGNFALCGPSYTEMLFTTPFINGANATIQGEGAYDFYAGYTNLGVASPGCFGIGNMAVRHNFTVGKGVDIEVLGNWQHDYLYVEGNMTASGILNVIVPTGGFLQGATKVIKTTGSFNGTFDVVNMPPFFSLQYDSDGVTLISDGTVSTGELETQQPPWQLSPTLATDEVRLTSGTSTSEDQTVWVMDAQGRIVQTLFLNKGAREMTISVDDLPAGLYHVQVVDGKEMQNLKFVKLR